jgi:dATP pyrophosphohydrolase
MEYKRKTGIKKIFDCYVYSQKGAQGTYHFLILKRSPQKKYAHQWRMIGGKVESGETYTQAAKREVREEIGISDFQNFWTVPDLNQFYEPETDQILQAPVFAVEIDANATLSLDDEHSDYRWINPQDAEEWIQWPQQVRLMQLTQRLLKQGILDDWVITSGDSK